MIKIELNGYWGDKSAFVKGELATIKSDLEKLFVSWNLDISRSPHIELVDKKMAKDQKAYDSINGNTVDIGNKNNWIKLGKALCIKTGKTCYGKDTHMTMIFAKNWKTMDEAMKIVESYLTKKGYKLT